MSQDGNTATMVATMLTTGDSFALCDECIVPWASALLGAMTGLDMEPILKAASTDEVTDDQVAAAEHAVDQGAPEASTVPTGRKARSGRTLTVSPDPGTDDDQDAPGKTPTDDAERSAA